MKDGDVVTVQYWHKAHPVPDGWEKVHEFGDNSHLWRAILIKEVDVFKIKPLSETYGHLSLNIPAKTLLKFLENVEMLSLQSQNADIRDGYIELNHATTQALTRAVVEAKKKSDTG
jgi:hypothetical protein